MPTFHATSRCPTHVPGSVDVYAGSVSQTPFGRGSGAARFPLSVGRPNAASKYLVIQSERV